MEFDLSKFEVIEKSDGNKFKKGNIPYNKGKTSIEDKRILSGKNHPMYGKSASELSKQRTREYNKLNPQPRDKKTGRFINS